MPSRRNKLATYHATDPTVLQTTFHRVSWLDLQASRIVVHHHSLRTKIIQRTTSVSIGATRLISNSIVVSTLIDDLTIVRSPHIRKIATGGHSCRELFSHLTDAQMLLVHRHRSTPRIITLVQVLKTGHGRGRTVIRHLQVMTIAVLIIMAVFDLVALQMVRHDHKLVAIPRLQVTYNRGGHHHITEVARRPLQPPHLLPHHDHL